jgi:flagellar biosynthetic protein FliQ
MNGLEVLDLGRDALWTTVIMCAPAMIAGLVVGLVIAFFQALTQIQEMTLVFVPKIVAIFAALLIFLPLMGATLATFAEQIFVRIAEF